MNELLETFECADCDATFTGTRYEFCDAEWGVCFGGEKEAYYCARCAARMHAEKPGRLGVYKPALSQHVAA
jgi:hypothetical protein